MAGLQSLINNVFAAQQIQIVPFSHPNLLFLSKASFNLIISRYPKETINSYNQKSICYKINPFKSSTSCYVNYVLKTKSMHYSINMFIIIPSIITLFLISHRKFINRTFIRKLRLESYLFFRNFAYLLFY